MCVCVFAGPNHDVIIIAVVCTVLVLLIICTVGVGTAGCAVLRLWHINSRSSPSGSGDAYKYPSKNDSRDDHDTGTFYLMPVSQQTRDGEDTIDSPVGSLEIGVKFPPGMQCGDSWEGDKGSDRVSTLLDTDLFRGGLPVGKSV